MKEEVMYSEVELRGRGLNLNKNHEPEGNGKDIPSYVPIEKKQSTEQKRKTVTNEVTNQLTNDYIVEEFLLRAEQCEILFPERVNQLLERAKRENRKK